MKRKVVLAAVLSLAVVTGGYGLVQAHGVQSRSGSGIGWFSMGSGHMSGPGWSHMGSGENMMGSGWRQWGSGYGGGFDGNGYGHKYQSRDDRHVTSEEAREIAEQSLGHNPYLIIGAITEEGDRFEIEIVTRKGQELVSRLLVEKETGRSYPMGE